MKLQWLLEPEEIVVGAAVFGGVDRASFLHEDLWSARYERSDYAFNVAFLAKIQQQVYIRLSLLNSEYTGCKCKPNEYLPEEVDETPPGMTLWWGSRFLVVLKVQIRVHHLCLKHQVNHGFLADLVQRYNKGSDQFWTRVGGATSMPIDCTDVRIQMSWNRIRWGHTRREFVNHL